MTTAFSIFSVLENPEAGPVIQGTGGLRKLRFADLRRQKGKRGGLRVVYYYWVTGQHFWLFTVYGKEMQDDLSSTEKKVLKQLLDAQLQLRGHHET